MATDLFEKLADLPVPPVPEAFDRSLHDRINTRLLMGQFLDLGMRGTGFALVHFARALLGFFKLTVAGKFESGPQDGSRPAP
jgi:hypothetical protein